MKFDDDALRASALSFQLIYRTRGLYQAFACLREFLEGHLPVARINGLYIPADHANVITMVDTLESRPVMMRREGRELPLLLWERLEEPLIVANLDPYKKEHTRGNPAAESLPFLRHHSLARLPVCRNEAYIFVINFWSDEYNAFARDDLTDLRIVTGGFVEELARDLSANLPAMPVHRSLTSGRDKLTEISVSSPSRASPSTAKAGAAGSRWLMRFMNFPRAGKARWSRSTAEPFLKRCWTVSFSGMRRGRLRAR